MAAGVTFNRFDWVTEYLDVLGEGCNSPQARAILDEMEKILLSALRKLRRAGLRNDGRAQFEPKLSTILRRGPGKVIAPSGDSSRAVRELRVRKSPPRKDSMEIRIQYPADFQIILDILAAGKPPLAGPRPTDGIPREVRREIAALIASRWGRFQVGTESHSGLSQGGIQDFSSIPGYRGPTIIG